MYRSTVLGVLLAALRVASTPVRWPDSELTITTPAATRPPTLAPTMTPTEPFNCANISGWKEYTTKEVCQMYKHVCQWVPLEPSHKRTACTWVEHPDKYLRIFAKSYTGTTTLAHAQAQCATDAKCGGVTCVGKSGTECSPRRSRILRHRTGRQEFSYQCKAHQAGLCANPTCRNYSLRGSCNNAGYGLTCMWLDGATSGECVDVERTPGHQFCQRVPTKSWCYRKTGGKCTWENGACAAIGTEAPTAVPTRAPSALPTAPPTVAPTNAPIPTPTAPCNTATRKFQCDAFAGFGCVWWKRKCVLPPPPKCGDAVGLRNCNDMNMDPTLNCAFDKTTKKCVEATCAMGTQGRSHCSKLPKNMNCKWNRVTTTCEAATCGEASTSQECWQRSVWYHEYELRCEWRSHTNKCEDWRPPQCSDGYNPSKCQSLQRLLGCAWSYAQDACVVPECLVDGMDKPTCLGIPRMHNINCFWDEKQGLCYNRA